MMRSKALLLYISAFLAVGHPMAQANLCGEDSRLPSEVRPVGRLYGSRPHSVCTVTLISDSCAITAGHCLGELSAEWVEFNVPSSTAEGNFVRSAPVDQYPVEKVIGKNTYVSKDWAVLRLGRNAVTQQLPGKIQGNLSVSSLSFKEIATQGFNRILRLTGYGIAEAERSHTQQSSIGPLVFVSRYQSLRYAVDSDGGNSGGALIDESTGQIIGIHTNGGCATDELANEGTAVAAVKAFQKAIRQCLSSDF